MQEKASTKEILEFIKLKQFIEPWQLSDKFGYTEKGSAKKLSILKKRGLLNNEIYGQWDVTEKGTARLIYYGKREREARVGTH
jgi:Mn-dependent DtxR family transcriptional regulator